MDLLEGISKPAEREPLIVHERSRGRNSLVWALIALALFGACALLLYRLHRLELQVSGLDDRFQTLTGIQFYYQRHVSFANGHIYYAQSPWGLSAISQVQFWRPEMLERYIGDAMFDGIISVDVSDWDFPGLNGRTARECSRPEVAAEIALQELDGDLAESSET